MAPKHRLRSIAFAVAGLVLLCLAGCSPHDPNAGLYAKAAIVVAVDTSVPGAAGRAWQTTDMGSIEKSASEANYLFDLWAYSSKPTHIWGPLQLLDYDEADAASAAFLAPVGEQAPRDGEPGLALAGIAHDPELAKLESVRVLLITDGYVARASAWNGIRSSARLVAARPGWRVELIGVAPNNAARWSRALSPILGSRFECASQARSTQLLEENRDE
jgi:hypothetical protein